MNKSYRLHDRKSYVPIRSRHYYLSWWKQVWRRIPKWLVNWGRTLLVKQRRLLRGNFLLRIEAWSRLVCSEVRYDLWWRILKWHWTWAWSAHMGWWLLLQRVVLEWKDKRQRAVCLEHWINLLWWMERQHDAWLWPLYLARWSQIRGLICL